MNKVIIGTVQFGIDYGITNKTGKIEEKDLEKIFEFCDENKLYLFDTAQDNGESENILSKYVKIYPNFKIITKFKFKKDIDLEVNKSIEKFEKIHYFLLHSFNDYKDDLINKLLMYKQIDKIGVSIYNVEEAKILLKDMRIKVIQLPFNYIDNQWDDIDFFELLEKRKDIEIHVRSIFLQGILLNPIIRNPLNIPKKDFDFLNEKIELICNKFNLTKLELCFAYINSIKWINKFLIGIDNLDHLILNFKIINNNIILNENQLNFIKEEMKDVNKIICNPSLWKF